MFYVAKSLPELIQPVDKRIEDVKEFLNSIDKTLIYEVVPISDPFGPTKSDPDLDVRIKTNCNDVQLTNCLLFSANCRQCRNYARW